jgi:hypothetical protein
LEFQEQPNGRTAVRCSLLIFTIRAPSPASIMPPSASIVKKLQRLNGDIHFVDVRDTTQNTELSSKPSKVKTIIPGRNILNNVAYVVCVDYKEVTYV